jgi:hypothetical protein
VWRPGGPGCFGELIRDGFGDECVVQAKAADPAGHSAAGEPVEVVVAKGLVDIWLAGVVVATHAQRFRDDQADRKPRARSAAPAMPPPD